MKIAWQCRPLAEVPADWLIVGVWEEEALAGAAAELDARLAGALTRLREMGDLAGKAKELTFLLDRPGMAAKRLVLVGLGPRTKAEQADLVDAAAVAARKITGKQFARVAMALPENYPGLSWEETALAVGLGLQQGAQGPGLRKNKPERFAPEGICLAAPPTAPEKEIQQGARGAEIIGRAVGLARDLVNTPPCDLYPETFAARAQEIAQTCSFECTIWDEKKLEAENMGSLLGVARGSERPPRLVLLRHRGGESRRLAGVSSSARVWDPAASLTADQTSSARVSDPAASPTAGLPLTPPTPGDLRSVPTAGSETRAEQGPGKTLGLVGKGVTFDSGGLSLKTTEQMVDMKCDMAGAAAVLAAIGAIAELGLPVNVFGVLALVENMPSGKSLKLGDVLRAKNGKTIEVLNTDAEGRLILADALAYAVEQKVDHLVDLATLTGACMVALGPEVAGLMTNNEAWGEQVLAAARRAGEKAWPLPMFPHYGEMIKSDVADMKNTGGSRYAGAISAAKFLEEFVGETPWVHLDIAGPAWAEKDSPSRDAGGTGCFVRTLVELARGYE